MPQAGTVTTYGDGSPRRGRPRHLDPGSTHRLRCGRKRCSCRDDVVDEHDPLPLPGDPAGRSGRASALRRAGSPPGPTHRDPTGPARTPPSAAPDAPGRRQPLRAARRAACRAIASVGSRPRSRTAPRRDGIGTSTTGAPGELPTRSAEPARPGPKRRAPRRAAGRAPPGRPPCGPAAPHGPRRRSPPPPRAAAAPRATVAATPVAREPRERRPARRAEQPGHSPAPGALGGQRKVQGGEQRRQAVRHASPTVQREHQFASRAPTPPWSGAARPSGGRPRQRVDQMVLWIGSDLRPGGRLGSAGVDRVPAGTERLPAEARVPLLELARVGGGDQRQLAVRRRTDHRGDAAERVDRCRRPRARRCRCAARRAVRWLGCPRRSGCQRRSR